MAQVRFLPSGQSVEVKAEQSLLSAALEAGVAIATACGGVANCTECKLEVIEGDANLSPMEYVEESKLGNVFHITRERLACQTQVLGPVTVQVLKEQLADKRVRARARALRRAKENLARKAAGANDDLRRRLALLNDDGGGADVQPLDPPRRRSRSPEGPPPSGRTQAEGEEGAARKPRRRRRRRARPKPATE